MWSAIRPSIANDLKKWMMFSVATSPMVSRAKSIDTSGQGRPERSTTARLTTRQWGIAISETGDAGAISECLVEGAPEDDGAVLDRVVVVHLSVTGGGEGQVESPVLGQGRQHVVEKAESSLDV